MPSSTSSSRPPLRVELKVLGLVAAVLLATEIGLRMAEPQMSEEYRTIASFDERAARLASAEASPRVLVLGNSLANDGLKPEVFLREMSVLQADVAVEQFALPGSEMCEWYWLFRSSFIDRQQRPDFVVLSAATFNDFPQVAISRLASLAGSSCYSDLMSADLPEFEQRATFVHSLLFRSFAGRDRIQKSLLNRLIPYYQQGRLWQHKMLRQMHDAPPDTEGMLATETGAYERLERFLALAREHRVQAVLVLMPLSGYYEVDKRLMETVQRHGAVLIDCRRTEQITPEMFYDGVHLSSDGAERFSRYLARRFRDEVLKESGPDGSVREDAAPIEAAQATSSRQPG